MTTIKNVLYPQKGKLALAGDVGGLGPSSSLPGDSRSWESPEKEDNVYPLSI